LTADNEGDLYFNTVENEMRVYNGSSWVVITYTPPDGSVTNVHVNASAAIAGSKIDPDFGSQTVETTGVFSAAGGAQATPSITFTGDTNTGIYSPGADQVAVATGGTQALYINSDGDILVADGNRMEIDEIRARDGAGLKLFDDAGAGIFVEDGGNVGIGTSAPDGPLHVFRASAGTVTANGNADELVVEHSGSGGISILTPDANHGYIIFGSPTSNEGAILRYRDADNIFTIGTEDANGSIQLRSGSGSTALTIDSSQRVGIGTTAPSMLFDVRGSVSAGGGSDNDLQQWGIASNNVKAELKYLDAAADRGMRFGTSTDHILGFQTNNTERMRIDSSGNVGIGTTSPNTLLHLSASTSPTITFTDQTTANTTGLLAFLNGTVAIDSKYNNGNGVIRFSGNNTATEYGRFDTSGRLLVGTSTDTAGGDTGAKVQIVDSGTPVLALSRNDTSIVAGNTIGQIRIFSNDDSAYQECARIAAQADGDFANNDKPTRLVFSTTADGSDSPTERMRIHSSGVVSIPNGIELGSGLDATAANTLDDYEEGTWTPTLTTNSTDFDSVSYQVRSGSYTKIGDLVFLRCNFYTNSVTKGAASGNIQVTGLPFTCAALAAVCLHDVRLWDGNPSTGASLNASGTRVSLFKRTTFNGNDASLQVSDVRTTNPGNLCQFSGCYKTA